jgi:hypothetical protein
LEQVELELQVMLHKAFVEVLEVIVLSTQSHQLVAVAVAHGQPIMVLKELKVVLVAVLG